jgi:hypothetical protein
MADTKIPTTDGLQSARDKAWKERDGIYGGFHQAVTQVSELHAIATELETERKRVVAIARDLIDACDNQANGDHSGNIETWAAKEALKQWEETQ